MPKMKTHRGAAKRFSKSGSGKISRQRANKQHILTKKTMKRKRRLRKRARIDEADEASVRRLLPYL